MTKPRQKRTTILANKKFITTLFILFITLVLFACVSTLVYWAPQIGRTTGIIDQNNYTTGKFIQKTGDYVPSFGRYNNTYESVVGYEIDGQKLTAETFVWSPRTGRTFLVYVDKNDSRQVATKTQREQAILQTSLATFVLLVGLGLGLYLYRKNKKRT